MPTRPRLHRAPTHSAAGISARGGPAPGRIPHRPARVTSAPTLPSRAPRVEEREGGDQTSTRIPSALALSAPSLGTWRALWPRWERFFSFSRLPPGPPDPGRIGLRGGRAPWDGLLLRAGEEVLHPSAVVVAPMLEVLPAPEERPVSPTFSGRGKRCAWAPRAAISCRSGWAEIPSVGPSGRGSGRVDEAPRYTASSGSK